MNKALELIINLTEAEYNGSSFNGPSLVKTLKALTLEQVTTTDTYEAYTVWGIVLHVAYWKYELARQLGADLGEFPYQAENFPALPESRTLEAWEKTLADMDVIHAAYITALKAFPIERYDEKMEWGCTFGQAIAWMTTHDTYHIAQIRNMGLKDLKFEGQPNA